MDRINSLPDEGLLYIFQYFSQIEIFCKIRCVCVRWKRMTFSPSFWRCLDMVEDNVGDEQFNLIWSKNNIKEVKSFVKKINICMRSHSRVQVFDKLKDCKLNRVEQLTIREAHHGNAETPRILEYLAAENARLSSLSLSFHTCNRLFDYFRIFSNLQLRKLELVHGGSRIRQNCCCEKQWASYFLKLCTGNGKNLREITIGVRHFNNVAVRYIFLHCKYLESLTLSRTNTRNDCFDELPQNTNLARLELHHVDITDATLMHISKYAPFLKNVELQGKLERITDHGMTKFVDKSKCLEKFSFRNQRQNAPNISDLTLFNIASNFISLKCLYLEEIKGINDAGFQAVVENSPNLMEIAMISCCNLTDLSLIALSDNCRLLKRVEFSGSVNKYEYMTNRGIGPLIKKLKYLEIGIFTEFSNLRNIKLSHNTDLNQLSTARGTGYNAKDGILDFEKFASNENHDELETVTMNSDHSHVRYLSFARCELLDDESVLQILKFCPDLRHIDLFSCSNISEGLHESVFELCKFISEVKINCKIFLKSENTVYSL